MLKVDHVTASYKTLDGNVVAVEDDISLEEGDEEMLERGMSSFEAFVLFSKLHATSSSTSFLFSSSWPT